MLLSANHSSLLLISDYDCVMHNEIVLGSSYEMTKEEKKERKNLLTPELLASSLQAAVCCPLLDGIIYGTFCGIKKWIEEKY